MKIITIAIEGRNDEDGGFPPYYQDVANKSHVIFRVKRSGEVVVQKRQSKGNRFAKKIREWMDRFFKDEDSAVKIRDVRFLAEVVARSSKNLSGCILQDDLVSNCHYLLKGALAEERRVMRERERAILEFCEVEMMWEYFRAEFKIGENPTESQQNAEKLQKFLQSQTLPDIDLDRVAFRGGPRKRKAKSPEIPQP